MIGCSKNTSMLYQMPVKARRDMNRVIPTAVVPVPQSTTSVRGSDPRAWGWDNQWIRRMQPSRAAGSLPPSGSTCHCTASLLQQVLISK